jgi:gliding motility-associated-like protein
LDIAYIKILVLKGILYKLFLLGMLSYYSMLSTQAQQNAACGEIIPVDYNTCASGDIPIFSSLCDVTFSMQNYLVFPQTSICNAPFSITNNPRFVAFIANGTAIVDITVIPSNCTFSGGTQGIQAALLGSCDSNDPVGTCSTTCPGINPINLTTFAIPPAGTVIYLMVDGCDFSVCDFVIEFNSGVDFPEASAQPGTVLEGPNLFCGEATFTVSPELIDVCTYFWTLPDGSTIETEGPELTLAANEGFVGGLLCVRGGNDCQPDILVPGEGELCLEIAFGEITYEVAVEQPACGEENGSIFLTITSAGGPYTIDWSQGGIEGMGGENLPPGLYGFTISDGAGCETQGAVELLFLPPLEVDVSVIDIDCSLGLSGSATLFASGGSGNYIFTWNPPVSTGPSGSNLEPGVYTVTVQDADYADCLEEITFEIQTLGELEADIEVTPTTCGLDNGSISVFPQGSGSYTYQWSGPGNLTGSGGTNLPAGTYFLTLGEGNSGCEEVFEIVVGESEALEVDVDLVNLDCLNTLGGSAVLNVSGGSGNYFFQWNPQVSFDNSADFLNAGTYFVTITDDEQPDCFVEISFDIEPIGEMPVEFVVTPTTCGLDNGSLSVTPFGIGPFSYDWSSPEFFEGGVGTNLPAGTYTANILDEETGCPGQISITVLPSALFDYSLVLEPIDCQSAEGGSASIAVTGGSGSYVYTWSPAVSNGPSASNLGVGTYFVTITDNELAECILEFSFEIETQGDLPVEVVVEPTLCGLDNGSFVLTPQGVGPYLYEWASPEVSGPSGENLSAGVYAVTIVDQGTGCLVALDILIEDSDPLTLSVDTEYDCSDLTGGSATLSISGGSGNYAFTWSPNVSTGPSASGLSAGVYAVTVVDLEIVSCLAEIEFEITAEGDLPMEIAIEPTTCNVDNGSIVLSPQGIGPYVYNWANPGLFDEGSGTGLPAGSYAVTVLDEASGCSFEGVLVVEDSSPLEIAPLVVMPNCNGSLGSIELTVNGGGSGNYAYIWSPEVSNTSSASGLEAGTYSIVVVDAEDENCTAAIEVELAYEGTLPLEIAVVNTLCDGPNGSIVVQGQGVGPYTYLWGDPGLFVEGVGLALPSGTYAVTVVDEGTGCTREENIVVDPSTPLQPTALVVNAQCNGTLGSAQIQVQGGSGDFSFVWQPEVSTGAQASDLEGGVYQVTILDNQVENCEALVEFTVVYEGELPVVFSLTPTLCNLNNGALQLNPQGVGPYDYVWSNPSLFEESSGSGLPAGTYAVTIQDASTGCQSEQMYTIPGSPALGVSANSFPADCVGGLGSIDLTVVNGSGLYAYFWDPEVSTGPSAQDLEAGLYTVLVEDQQIEGCSSSIEVEVLFDGVLPVNFTVEPTTCGQDNGSIALFPFGQGDFSYDWTQFPSEQGSFIANLAPGSYEVEIVFLENGCNNTLLIVVPDSDPLSVQIDVQGTQCALANGSASVQVSGGSGQYFFEWSTGSGSGAQLGDLAEGLYAVTVTDSEDETCQEVLEFEVQGSDAPEVLLVNIEDTSCGLPNGSIEVAVTGGSGSYLFLWNGIDLGNPATGLAGGSYELTVLDLLVEGCEVQSSYFVDFSEGVPLPIVEGITELCWGQTAVYAVTNGEEGVFYNWVIVEGEGTLLSGQGTETIEILWTGGTTGLICVDFFTDCGISPATCLPVILVGSAEIDLGEDLSFCGLTGTLQGSVNGGSGNWSQVSGPGDLVFLEISNPASQVQASEMGTYVIRYTVGQGDCLVEEDLVLVFVPPPSATVQSLCEGDVYALEIVLDGGQSPYVLVSGNAAFSIVGDTVFSEPLPSGFQYSLILEDALGCRLELSGGVNCDCFWEAGQMPSDTLQICGEGPLTVQVMEGTQTGGAETVFVYVLLENPGDAPSEALQVSATGVFVFDPLTMEKGRVYYVAAVAAGDDGMGNPDFTAACLEVSNFGFLIWWEPPVLVGESLGQSCDLLIALVLNGFWEDLDLVLLSGPGSFSVQGALGDTSLLLFDVPGVYGLQWRASVGDFCRDSLSLEWEFLPRDLALVEGPFVDCTATGEEFEVRLELGGGSGEYVLVGGTPVGGEIVGDIFRSGLMASDTDYEFVFTDSNGCDTVVVSGNGECDCVTRVGRIEETGFALCEGEDLVLTYDATNEVLDPNDVVNFVLYEGTSGSIVNIIQVSSSAVISWDSSIESGVTYYVRAWAGDDGGDGWVDGEDPCLSESVGRPVVWYGLPSGVIEDIGAQCSREVEVRVAGEFEGIGWSVVSGPGTGIFDSSTSNPSTLSVSGAGVYGLEALLLSGGGLCSLVLEGSVEFLPRDLVVESWDVECNGTSTEFEVVVELGGGSGEYVLVGGTPVGGEIVGDLFRSEWIETGGSFVFVFTDVNGCDTVLVEGQGLCNCITRVGRIEESGFALCEGEDLVLTYDATNEVLDPNDVVNFVLYEGSLTVINNVLARSVNGVFAWDGSYELGVTYYVQAMAGDDGGAGWVDEGDVCLRRSTSRPVVWYGYPEGFVVEQDLVCGLEAEVRVEGSYDSVEWLGVTGPGTGTIDGTGSQVILRVTQGGVYEVRVRIGNRGLCYRELVGLVEFGTGGMDYEGLSWECDETNQFYVLSFAIQGGTPPYVLLGGNAGGVLTGNEYRSDSLASGSGYRVEILDSEGCGVLLVEGRVDCECTSQAGEIVSGGIELCDGELAEVVYDLSGEVLDGNDQREYILYEGTGGVLGRIISRNITGRFEFPEGEELGRRYYIVVVVGDGDGLGGVDKSDPCLSYSNAIEVTWYGVPQAIGLVEGKITCEEPTVQLFGSSDMGTGSGIVITWFTEFGDPVGEGSEVEVGEGGLYVVAAENILGCGTRDSVEVEIEDGLISSVQIGLEGPVCFGSSEGRIEILEIEGGVAPYSYSLNGGPYGSVRIWEGLSSGTYSVGVRDANGCVTVRNLVLLNPEALGLDLGLDLVIKEGESVRVFGDFRPLGLEIESYLWSYNGVSLGCEDCSEIEFIPQESGVLRLEIVDSNGCRVEAEIRITVLVERIRVYIPNVFTPNGDGLNDVFRMYNTEEIGLVNSFMIFDRWGGLLHKAEGVDPGSLGSSWDGRVNGREAEQAVYVYQISVTLKNGDARVYSGDVTLLR